MIISYNFQQLKLNKKEYNRRNLHNNSAKILLHVHVSSIKCIFSFLLNVIITEHLNLLTCTKQSASNILQHGDIVMITRGSKKQLDFWIH